MKLKDMMNTSGNCIYRILEYRVNAYPRGVNESPGITEYDPLTHLNKELEECPVVAWWVAGCKRIGMDTECIVEVQVLHDATSYEHYLISQRIRREI